MTVNITSIPRGDENGLEKINLNFNEVKTELERMNGSIVTIPKEQFTKINGTISMDTNACKCTIFKFNNFAIMQIATSIGVTMNPWTHREVVSVPKSYFNGYSKFTLLGSINRVDDQNVHFDNDFHLDTAALSINTRGAEWNNKGAELAVCGILYN
ncbi:hypothetical protein SY111_16330 [Ligilactobacillus agilis]|uniref:Uncharacterized protein n=1 Tax=Ligilactobacillus agilis TaxID=1601 RepID=A0A6F9XUS3_9LACO|nr:hypothetical protein [Ligilactobacillus agilis]GET09009.1 hypothetical protein SY111_16330 [Ligilactobacillus agilis]